MIINGINIKKEIANFQVPCVERMIQFFERLEIQKDLTRFLRGLQDEQFEKLRSEAEKGGRKIDRKHFDRFKKGKSIRAEPTPQKEQTAIVEPFKYTQVVGICPRCSSKVVGGPQPKCETKASGRVFFKECSACTYYVEIFKRGNKHREVEGG